MRKLGRLALCSVALAAPFAAQASSSSTSLSATFEAETAAPEGFEEIAGEREALVDVYFGGKRIGETRVIASPGSVRLLDPATVAALIPNLESADVVVRSLSGDLPSNAARVCSAQSAAECGRLSPAVAAVIHDEDHFRLDLFVNPKLLAAIDPVGAHYLAAPEAGLALTDSTGFTLSGGGGHTEYNLQNRAILAFGNARLRSDSSYSSGFGVVVDNLVAEVDRPDRRYSAGMFWAPGLDLIGQRRIIGAGFGTQFDTRADRETLQGTPLLLFLQQTSRVELLVDGRLIGSRLYDAGNNVLDTAALPDGSYMLTLRVHEAGGGTREERRFFVKNAQIAPLGQPIVFAYAGVLANTRANHIFSPSKRLFYEAGTARRLNRNLALDVAVIGTDQKAILQAGGYFITPLARLRVAALASSKSDKGGFAQLVSSSGPLAFAFDVRRIWSGDGRPLIPFSIATDSFAGNEPTAAQIGAGSYTQATGSVGVRLGSAYLSMLGSLRKDEGAKSSYSIGPSLAWTMIQRSGVQVTLNADAQRTRETTAAFVGIRLLSTFNGFSTTSSVGHASLRDRIGGDSVSRQVGSLSGEWFHQAGDRTQLTVGGGLDRSLESTIARAGGTVYSPLGSARGELFHDFEGKQSATQYTLTLQSSAALADGGVGFGGRDLEQSALIAAVDGAPGSNFDLFVDGMPRGRLKGGSSLPVFLQPYRAYKVRLQPIDAPPMSFDSADREVVLYPGNVRQVRWAVEDLFTVFGQAIGSDGKPVADARVESRRSIGQTDSDGYFQIDVGRSDSLVVTPGGGTCRIALAGAKPRNSYASLGKVKCL